MKPLLGKLLLCSCLSVVVGCRESASPDAAPPRNTQAEVTLHVLVVDDPELAAEVERQWTARGGSLVVRETTAAKLAEPATQHLNADVIVYPTSLLGELVERHLVAPVSRETLNDPEFHRRDILELPRLNDCVFGGQTYAVSMGSPAPVLYYRRDLLAQADCPVPATWKQLQETVARLQEEASSPAIISLEPLSPRWAGQMLLNRAAGYVYQSDQLATVFDLDTMEPLLDSPPFVRALEELMAVNGEAALTATPRSCLEAIYSGETVMALTWPTPLANVDSDKQLDIAIAASPGSEEVYRYREAAWSPRAAPQHVTLAGLSGRLASVTQYSSSPAASELFLIWLAGKEMSPILSRRSLHTTWFRRSQFGTPSSWMESTNGELAKEYAEVTHFAQKECPRFQSLRLPGTIRYLAALDAAVARAVSGEVPAEQALGAAADEWHEITRELGVERQRSAHRRSLGLGR